MSRCRFADVVLDPEPSAGEEGVTKLAFRVGLTAYPLPPPFRRGTWLTANVLHAAGCRVHSPSSDAAKHCHAPLSQEGPCRPNFQVRG